MKKICFYYRMFLYGGVEIAILNLAKLIHNKYELHFVYSDDSDEEFLQELSKYGKVEKIEDNMKFDIIIWGGLYFEYDKVSEMINADYYISWIHSIPYIYPNCLLKNDNFINQIDKFVCVSEEVKYQFKNITEKNGVLIHNELDVENIIKKSTEFEVKRKSKLELVFVGRLSEEKGLYRIPKLLNELEKEKQDYHLTIVGKAFFPQLLLKYIKIYEKYNVDFVGKQKNPYPFIKNADYLISFSDFESWCLVITEAKILNVPILVTNFASAYEQVENDKNGLIFKMNEEEITRQLDDNPKNNIIITQERIKKLNNHDKYVENLKKWEYKSEYKKWIKILNSFKSQTGWKFVEATITYYDLFLEKRIIKWSKIKMPLNRIKYLKKLGYVKEI